MTAKALRPLRTIRPADECIISTCGAKLPVDNPTWTCPLPGCQMTNVRLCLGCRSGHMQVVHGVGRG